MSDWLRHIVFLYSKVSHYRTVVDVIKSRGGLRQLFGPEHLLLVPVSLQASLLSQSNVAGLSGVDLFYTFIFDLFRSYCEVSGSQTRVLVPVADRSRLELGVGQ